MSTAGISSQSGFTRKVIKEGYIVEIGDRFGNWQPTTREIIVELVGIGQESFTDDGTGLSLRFDGVD